MLQKLDPEGENQKTEGGESVLKTMVLGEFCRTYPETKAKAFRVKNDLRTYFMIEDKPQLFKVTRPNQIRAKIKCFCVAYNKGKIFEVVKSIKASDTITPLTCQQFTDIIMGNLKKFPELKAHYALYGFKEGL